MEIKPLDGTDLDEFINLITNNGKNKPEFTQINESLARLKQAAEETVLIEKYGKKKIENLAKKIKYHGEIINKLNTKTNVNKN